MGNDSNKIEEVYTIILEDDPMVPKIIERATKIRSRHFGDPEELLKNLNEMDPVGAFIDINLGTGQTGLDIIPILRKNWPFCPILVITSSPTQGAIASALASGADDFVQKPIIPEEVVARLKLRMEDAAQKAAKEIIQFGDISIDSVHRVISGPKGNRYASPIEITLLTTLAHTEGTITEKEALKMRCWGQIKVTDNALHRKLHAVRQILRDVSDNVVIQTKYGVGFSLRTLNTMSIAS